MARIASNGYIVSSFQTYILEWKNMPKNRMKKIDDIYSIVEHDGTRAMFCNGDIIATADINGEIYIEDVNGFHGNCKRLILRADSLDFLRIGTTIINGNNFIVFKRKRCSPAIKFTSIFSNESRRGGTALQRIVDNTINTYLERLEPNDE